MLRPEDRAEAREQDHREIELLLQKIGQRLGFSVKEEPISWVGFDQDMRFHVIETAALLVEVPELLQAVSGEAGQRSGAGAAKSAEAGGIQQICVFPGGRSVLFTEKVRRDPRLALWLDSGGRVMKFRHVRRLADETTLSRENLLDRLGIDPPEHQDPQMPLL
jgi:hypothetical protein